MSIGAAVLASHTLRWRHTWTEKTKLFAEEVKKHVRYRQGRGDIIPKYVWTDGMQRFIDESLIGDMRNRSSCT